MRQSQVIIKTSLINNLKRQVTDLRQKMKDLQVVHSKLKRDKKITKLGELEMEIQVLTNESVRMRGLLDEAYDANKHLKKLETSQVDSKEKDKALKIMQNENTEMAFVCQEKESQVKKLEESGIEKSQIIDRLKKQVANLKKARKAMRVREKDLMKFRNEVKKLEEDKVENHKRETMLKNNLESKEKLISDLRSQVTMLKNQSPIIQKVKVKSQQSDIRPNAWKDSSMKDKESVFSLSKDSFSFTPLNDKSQNKDLEKVTVTAPTLVKQKIEAEPAPRTISELTERIKTVEELKGPLYQLEMMMNFSGITPAKLWDELSLGKASAEKDHIADILSSWMPRYPEGEIRDLVNWLTQGGNKILRTVFVSRLESHYGRSFVPLSDKGNQTEMARIKRRLSDSRWILLEQIFNLIDTKSDGYASFDEFDSSCQGIKLELSHQE